jgi:hypothetical protein
MPAAAVAVTLGVAERLAKWIAGRIAFPVAVAHTQRESVTARFTAYGEARVRSALTKLVVGAIICSSAAFLVAPAPVARAADQTAACTSTVGPGIPPPTSLPSGLPGFHAAWYGQSGYPTLCPGERSTATVAYYNSGSFGWVKGRMGEMAFLGTSDPIPGHDGFSQLGGAAGNPPGSFSPNTGWPSNNRIAAQPADYVGPGQVAWFQFTIQAPNTPGTYFLYLRPVIEGATWMEDYGVYWQVTVKQADAVGSIIVAPSAAGTAETGATRTYTATVNGAPGCVDLALIDDASYPATFEGGLVDADANGRADLSTTAVFTLVNGASNGTSYVDCVTLPADQTVTFFVSSSIPNTNVRPVVFRDENNNNAIDVGLTNVPSEPWDLGGAVRFVPPEATTGTSTVTVLAVSTAEDYFTDAGATATYRYDTNDTFRRSGSALSLAQFEQVLTRGDTLAITYQADVAESSTFNITNDLGREAPTVVATVDSWDQGPTQNDVGLQITEPPTNVNGIGYSVQRARTGVGTGCDAGSGGYAELSLTSMGDRSDTTMYIDRDLAVGAYCYRVGATDPVTGIVAFGYSQRVIINNPPTPVSRPRSLDARVTTSAGSLAALDTGDVIKIAFNKVMRSPVGGQIRVQDADGTIADIRCLVSEQACTINSGAETLGGVVYPANMVITIAMRTEPLGVAAGVSAGLQLNVTVTSGGFADIAGNGWDINGSDDVILGAPD